LNGSQITNERRYGLALVGGPSKNLIELDSLLFPNFSMQDYMPLSAVPQPALYVPLLQQLLATNFEQPARLTRAAMSGPLVFDMMEDLPTTDINAEQVDMNMKPSSADRAVKAGGDHPPSMDSEECTFEVDIVVYDTDEEENEVLLLKNWEGVMAKEYKDFDKHRHSYQRKIQELENKLKGPTLAYKTWRLKLKISRHYTMRD
jgi:hypothetical protein